MTATRETIAEPASPGHPAVSPGPRAAGISAGVWAAMVLAALAGVALTFLARDALKGSDLIFNLAASAAAVAYATLGALIVRRVGNPIGWLMLAESAGQVLLTLANTYCLLGITTFPGAAGRRPQVQPGPLRRRPHGDRVRRPATGRGRPRHGPRRPARHREPDPGTRPALDLADRRRPGDGATERGSCANCIRSIRVSEPPASGAGDQTRRLT
jgi:hypothetical protein